MKASELILLLAAIILWIYVVSGRKLGRTGGVIAALLGSGAVVGYLLAGDYRWQLLPACVVIGGLVLWCALKRPKVSPARSWRRKTGKALLLLLMATGLAVSAALALLLPVVQLPEPGGPFAVGTQTVRISGTGRAEPFTEDPQDTRELMVQLWYPADNTEGLSKATVVPVAGQSEMAEPFTRAFAQTFRLPPFALDYWKNFRGNSFENADVLPSSAPYPVVLLSHGMGTSRMLHVSQAEHLASHGYVVITIDHTYNTTATIFPDGKITGLISEPNEDEDFFTAAPRMGKVWAGDVSEVIDWLEAMNAGQEKNPFRGRLDLQNIGMMGHSFGGATAFHAVLTEDRLKAGINMDGTQFDKYDGKTVMKKPFLFLESADFKAKADELRKGKIQSELGRRIVSNELALMEAAAKHHGKALYVERTDHYNFTDLQFYSPLVKLTGLTGELDGARGAEIVNAYVLDFFDTYLKGSQPKLVNGPSSAYPEVKFDLKLEP
ncbi:alpha/beta hydrolase family protein [Paenibacillus sp. A14]|uniref:alpha/beta hydrolase family protein n=1 Tax=Paenibacillus sp. A14 TaxID=3119820 RepID=UPI002FE0B34E